MRGGIVSARGWPAIPAALRRPTRGGKGLSICINSIAGLCVRAACVGRRAVAIRVVNRPASGRHGLWRCVGLGLTHKEKSLGGLSTRGRGAWTEPLGSV